MQVGALNDFLIIPEMGFCSNKEDFAHTMIKSAETLIKDYSLRKKIEYLTMIL